MVTDKKISEWFNFIGHVDLSARLATLAVTVRSEGDNEIRTRLNHFEPLLDKLTGGRFNPIKELNRMTGNDKEALALAYKGSLEDIVEELGWVSAANQVDLSSKLGFEWGHGDTRLERIDYVHEMFLYSKQFLKEAVDGGADMDRLSFNFEGHLEAGNLVDCRDHATPNVDVMGNWCIHPECTNEPGGFVCASCKVVN